jgi:hypothetical protein
LIHCHHCHCCVRCRRCQNHHCRLNFVVGMLQRSFEWPADQVFLRHFVLLQCYRQITTMWFKWCRCHCYWRRGKFGVANGVWQKKSVQTTSICVAKENQVFIRPLFYGALVQILQECSTSPVLMSQTRSKMRCG